MRNRYAARTGRSAVRYRIVIRGTLAQPPVGPLEGMTLETAGDESVLVGDVVDQAHLQGIIGLLSDLGVEIVSINPAGPQPDVPS
ncbi:MAG TPA: hypothetical protein VD704_06375 [Gaiellaceae bacterium]|nr:hypothetical protein [Gaiellaceae bacterium]